MRQVCLLLLLPFLLLAEVKPTTVIQGSKSKLVRPEGIAFSPTGDCLVTADSEANAIALFRRIGDSGGKYETVPTFFFQDNALFAYPHDVCFSPDGKYLAVVTRYNNCVFIFKRDPENSTAFIKEPHCVITGDASKLAHPASLSFSPDGKMLGVTNRKNGGIVTFFKQSAEGVFGTNVDSEISEQDLIDHNLAHSHGISFCPVDGSVAIVCKNYSGMKRGESALAQYTSHKVFWGATKWIPAMVDNYGYNALHSICHHPNGQFIAVSDGNDVVTIFKRDQLTHNCTAIQTIAVERVGRYLHEGPKGVAFTPCGKFLGITTVAPMVKIYPFDVEVKE